MREKGDERSEKEKRKRRKKSKSWPKTSNEERNPDQRQWSLPLAVTLSYDVSLFLFFLSLSPSFLFSLLSEEKEDRKRREERERKGEKSQLMPSRNHSRWVDVLRLSSLYLWIPDNFILRGKERVRNKLKERERERRTKWEAVKKERNVWMMMLWNRKKILDWEEKGAFLTFLLGRFFVLFPSFSSVSFPFFLSLSEDKDF